MNLERVEQVATKYLKEVDNPLVPVDRLMRHLDEQGVLAGASERELLGFLYKHDLFRVLDPPGVGDDPAMRGMMDAVGFNTKPYVILDTRLPTRADLAAGLEEQLLAMAEALISAIKEAREKEDFERAQDIERMLDRVTAARKKLRDFA